MSPRSGYAARGCGGVLASPAAMAGSLGAIATLTASGSSVRLGARAGYCCIRGSCVGSAYMGGQP
jgi:hypothetical protein